MTSNRVGLYLDADSTNGGRIRTDLFDPTQRISVITCELMQDMGATDSLKALELVTGIAATSTRVGHRLSMRLAGRMWTVRDSRNP